MDIRKLPVGAPTMTVGQALTRMQHENVSGIAVKQQNNLLLINYGDLIASRYPTRQLLARVESFRSVPNITELDARRFHLPIVQTLPMPQQEFDRVDDFLRERGYFYAVFGRVGTHVNLLSISERGLEVYSATPKDCYCSDKHYKHGYDRGNHPKLCDVDQTKVICI
jgi:hypothetical protein